MGQIKRPKYSSHTPSLYILGDPSPLNNLPESLADRIYTVITLSRKIKMDESEHGWDVISLSAYLLLGTNIIQFNSVEALYYVRLKT